MVFLSGSSGETSRLGPSRRSQIETGPRSTHMQITTKVLTAFGVSDASAAKHLDGLNTAMG
jgi:hypothetical protein